MGISIDGGMGEEVNCIITEVKKTWRALKDYRKSDTGYISRGRSRTA